ncbi:MAG TPA: AbrB/MazE/SpoVT family DNA-binding domain-containing protein [Candidatus Nanoarchaeia archaeon]|nr:AbrB/MazE/SpoVT family DNA-binding domain-containing protein [Candidatus Nanoarchaeia archaeon]
MDINITRMSSKGQIVIPQEMRQNFKEGEKILVIQGGDKLILKKASDMDENLKEDLDFAKRTEEAWKKFERGEFISMDSEDFLKEMKKW